MKLKFASRVQCWLLELTFHLATQQRVTLLESVMQRCVVVSRSIRTSAAVFPLHHSSRFFVALKSSLPASPNSPYYRYLSVCIFRFHFLINKLSVHWISSLNWSLSWSALKILSDINAERSTQVCLSAILCMKFLRKMLNTDWFKRSTSICKNAVSCWSLILYHFTAKRKPCSSYSQDSTVLTVRCAAWSRKYVGTKVNHFRHFCTWDRRPHTLCPLYL